MSEKAHFSTRRGFVAAVGFGLVSLYLLWAGYGAAPLGLGGHGERAGEDAGEQGAAHGEHGAAPAGPSREEFRKRVAEFVEQYQLPDGSVRPGLPHHGPADVYLMAYQWGYAPATLRLEAGVPYRFRMMAVDSAHGASLQLGPGAHIVRLRPGVLVEQELRFTKPGEYLLYCTVYCGLPHDRMQGRIVVTQPGSKS